MRFTYGSGQRPLDGYTIKRGVGAGGFGEVYFAVSDGGKEVALKLVRGNLDVELRGVAQCLNLKHANLVHLFDQRTDAQGDRWVVMEYVSGEPLSVVLARHPHGLAPELAQQWFIALANATGYLHDHGIVHRDLKPGNIFLENGIIKVGDYGLSKFMSSSQRTAQTQSVGTVHYMAPEISTGNYNRQIDIYAAGIILYEMLTGHVPFDGESAGEILMKHLTSPPDLSKLPPAYVEIVGKALSKNPAHRFPTMAEMAKAVEQVGLRAQAAPVAIPVSGPPVKAKPASEPILTVLPATTIRGQIAELCGSMALAVLFALAASTVLAAFNPSPGHIKDIGIGFFTTVMVSWAVMIPAKLWAGQRGDSWGRRLLMTTCGVLVGMGALWLNGWSPNRPFNDSFAVGRNDDTTAHYAFAVVPQYLSYFGLTFFALRWWRIADRRRAHRFSLAPVLAAGFWAYAPLMIWQDLWLGATSLVVAAAIVQLVSPWEPAPAPAARRMRIRYA
jgi:hypothetical protein